jgi:hypothetical protein
VIVADNGAILALIDTGARHHLALRPLHDAQPDEYRSLRSSPFRGGRACRFTAPDTARLLI